MAKILNHSGQQQTTDKQSQHPMDVSHYLHDYISENDSIDNDLLEHLCSSDEIWNGIEFPELPDELLGHFTKDFQQSSFDDFPGLTTPPESPPDTIPSSSSSPVQPVIDSCFLSSLDTPLTPLQAPPTIHLLPTSQSIDIQNCNIDTTSCHQGVKNDIVRNDGHMVQVLKSGEIVPISALLATMQSNPLNDVLSQTKQEVIGQKRPHPSSPTASSPPEVKFSKRQQRLIKNRESASISRQKKKEYVSSLESKLREAAIKNITLLKENEKLKQHITKIEKENQTLRYSYSQPVRSPLSSAPKPAMVFVLVLCFTLAIFPLRSYITYSTPITSLTVPLNPTGRALMSINDKQQQQQQQQPTYNNNNRINKLLKPERILELDSNGVPTDTICSCPIRTDKHNVSRAMNLNSELSVSFHNEELLIMNMLQKIDDTNKEAKQQENSLMIANGVEQVRQPSYDGDCYCRNGVFKFYKSLKKSMPRDFGNYYLVSFKDHLLLNAPLRNNTNNPVLSVIVPAHNNTYHTPPGSMAMLQLDCQVFDSKIFHIDTP